MWEKIAALSLNKKIILATMPLVMATGVASVANQNNPGSESLLAQSSNQSYTESEVSSAETSKIATTPICDGVKITENCEDEDGVKYTKYVYHEAVEEETEEVEHPAEPAKTHTVTHDAVYGTRETNGECVKATMGKYKGQCAKSLCADGAYSGATGSGSCSHHGGVVATGPWYTTKTETYVVTPAYTETVIDEPAKDAWTETVTVTPAQDEWWEKVEAEE